MALFVQLGWSHLFSFNMISSPDLKIHDYAHIAENVLFTTRLIFPIRVYNTDRIWSDWSQFHRPCIGEFSISVAHFINELPLRISSLWQSIFTDIPSMSVGANEFVCREFHPDKMLKKEYAGWSGDQILSRFIKILLQPSSATLWVILVFVNILGRNWLEVSFDEVDDSFPCSPPGLPTKNLIDYLKLRPLYSCRLY